MMEIENTAQGIETPYTRVSDIWKSKHLQINWHKEKHKT